MTFKALRLCRHPRCLTRVSSHQRYLCDEHLKNKWKLESKRVDDKFYQTSTWRKFSAAFKRANPFCKLCKDMGRTSRSQVTDHIVPRSQGGKPYDFNNLQALCHQCHNRKRQTEK